MEGRGSHENRLVYSVDIPTLQQITSYQVALSILHSNFFRLKHNDFKWLHHFASYGLPAIYRKDCGVLVETLNMPKSTKKLINIALKGINDEMREWSSELNCIDVKFNDPNWCVWSIDGKIDRERSARRTLSTASELSDVQKFAIMCEYCLENEIAKFPVDSLPLNLLEQKWAKCDKLIEYWYYYAKNEYHLTPTYAEVVMSFGPKKWIPFQYFWQRMSKDWQIRVAGTILKYFYDDDETEMLRTDMQRSVERLLGQTYNVSQFFMTLSCELQCHLLSKKLMDVISMLIRYGGSLKPVCWIWTYYKDLISVSNFVEIVKTLIDFRFKAEEWVGWLINVWDSVSDQFKIAAAERVKNLVWNSFTIFVIPPTLSHSAFIFLCRILSLQDMDFRKESILKSAVNFGLRIVDHHSMNEVLKVCLPNKDERLNFKKMVVESGKMEKTCVDLLYESNLDHLNMMLDFYCTSPDEVRKFKKELLKSKTFNSRRFMFHEHDWYTLSTFIDEIYPENDSLAARTRKQLIISWDFDFISHDMTQLIKIVESEFDVVEVYTLKRVWFHLFRSTLETRNGFWCEIFLKTKSSHCFLKWCVGDGDRAIPEYECEAFIDTIFDGIFRALNEKYTEERGFQFDETVLVALDEYLKLNLMSDGKVKMYKSSRRTSSNVEKIFQAVASRNDESSLQKLLKYGFQSI